MSAETETFILCDLETYLGPPTVLCQRQEQRRTMVQGGSGAGEEQHTSTVDTDRHLRRSRSRGLIKAMAQGL
jgi:hypothetical protein